MTEVIQAMMLGFFSGAALVLLTFFIALRGGKASRADREEPVARPVLPPDCSDHQNGQPVGRTRTMWGD